MRFTASLEGSSLIPINDLVSRLTHPDRQQNIEDDFEVYRREHVVFSRRIIRYAKSVFPAFSEIPQISLQVSRILAVIEEFDTYRLIQRLSQEIVRRREALWWLETDFPDPDPIALYDAVRLKREIIGCVDELSDLVTATDDLMKYGIHDEDDEYRRNRLRRKDIVWKAEPMGADNGDLKNPSLAQAKPRKLRRKSKRLRARSNRASARVRRPRKRQPLSSKILNSIRKTILVWSLAFKT